MPSPGEPTFWDYVKAAFFVRKPVRLLGAVPINLLYVLGVAVAGLAAPGLWLIGGGLELGWLAWLAQNDRFRAVVRAGWLHERELSVQERLEALVAGLAPDSLARWRRLAARCDAVRSSNPGLDSLAGGSANEVQATGLRSLELLYLRLLDNRQSLLGYLRESSAAELQRKLEETRKRLETASSEAMRRPLEATVELLRRRLEQNAAARHNLEVVEAELDRLDNQVDLIREEAAVSRDPAVLSARIDAVARTIGEASQFLKTSEALLGDLGPESAAVPPRSRGTVAQGRQR